jgi:hypothetical protein
MMLKSILLPVLLLVVVLGYATTLLGTAAPSTVGAVRPTPPGGTWGYPVPGEMVVPKVGPQSAPVEPPLVVPAAPIDAFEAPLSPEVWPAAAQLAPQVVARRAGKGINNSYALALRHDGVGSVTGSGPLSTTELVYALSPAEQDVTRAQGVRVSVAFYDDMRDPDNQIGLVVRGIDAVTGEPTAIAVGIWPSRSKDFYVYCARIDAGVQRDECMPTPRKRSTGWHTLQINVTPKGSYGKIDNESFSYLPAFYSVGTTRVTSGSVNGGLLVADEAALFVRGQGTGDSEWYFDNFDVVPYPPFLGDTAVAEDKVREFLRSYEGLKLFKRADDTLVARYEPGLRPVFAPSLLQRIGNAYIARYLMDAPGNREHPDYQRSVDIIRYMADSYNYDGQSGWNAPSSSSDPLDNHFGAITANKLLNNAWLMWPDLPDDLKRQLAARTGERPGIFVDLARKLEQLLANDSYVNAWARPEYIGTSKQEGVSWLAIYFLNIALAFGDHPNAACWHNYARFFANNALSANETWSVTVCDGNGNGVKTIAVTTRTISDDMTVDEHLYHPNISYTTSTVNILSVMRLLNRRIRGSDEPAFGHRVPEVYTRALEFVDLRNFQFKGSRVTRRGSGSNGEIVPVPFLDPQAFFSPYKLSRRQEGVADATSMTMFRTLAEVYGAQLNDARLIATVPPDEFAGDDIARHNAEYVHYIYDGYLWKATPIYKDALPAEVPLTGVLNGVPYNEFINNHTFMLQQNATSVNDILGQLQYFDQRLSSRYTPLTVP